MNRIDLLRRAAALPFVGAAFIPLARLSSPALVVEGIPPPMESPGVAFQFGEIVEGAETPCVRVSSVLARHVSNWEPDVSYLRVMAGQGFTHMWRYTMRDGIRYVESMRIAGLHL